jgi:asparagine synthetase A
MSDNLTTPETKVTLSVQQLESLIRKVVREELVEFAAQELGIFHLDKESPLYEDMEDILERKKSDQLKFHIHEEIWKERNARIL